MSSPYTSCSNVSNTQEDSVFSPLSYQLTCTPSNIGVTDISITGLGGINISSTTDMNFLKMQLN